MSNPIPPTIPAAGSTPGLGRIVRPRPEIPVWFHQRFLGGAAPERCDEGESKVHLWETPEAGAATILIREASGMPPAVFGLRAREAYAGLLDLLEKRGFRFPIRCWNLLPDIHRRCGKDRDRYMVFNAARFQAFRSWAGQDSREWTHLPTATGVGHSGDDLFLSCLATREPGRNVENPRQRPAYAYSDQYGPLPPCFARATVAPGGKLLLVGGTASVRGEETMHAGDLERQTDETFTNLSRLAAAAENTQASAPANNPEDEVRWLARYVQLRVYGVHAEDRTYLLQRVQQSFPGLDDLEWMQADLCRRDLLVEIEGVVAIR